MSDERAFKSLEEYLAKVPGMVLPFGHGFSEQGQWWVKFSIDISHPLAWNVVQEFGHVLNYLSVNERLPTTFKPVSPPPYMNGGPKDYLSWVIECSDKECKPGTVTKCLEGHLPRPVEDIEQWPKEE